MNICFQKLTFIYHSRTWIDILLGPPKYLQSKNIFKIFFAHTVTLKKSNISILCLGLIAPKFEVPQGWPLAGTC